MHALVVSGTFLSATALAVNQISLRSRQGGDFGLALALAPIYAFGIFLGTIGWVVSAIVLIRRQTPTAQRVYAAIYIILGGCGLALAYYAMQAE